MSRSQRRLDELGISVPAPFDLDQFVAQVEQRVGGGRRIRLTEFQKAPGEVTECGYVILFRERDYDHVLFAPGLSPRARAHNAVHELAHMILGHRGVQLAIGAIDRSEIISTQQQEDEADALAAVVLSRWDEPPRGFAARQVLALTVARADEAFR